MKDLELQNSIVTKDVYVVGDEYLSIKEVEMVEIVV